MTVPLNHLAGKSIAVFGLARSGLATVAAARAGGVAEIFAYDDREGARAEAVARGAIAAPFDQWSWERLACLVLAPGVPFTHPEPHAVVKAARAAGVPVTSDNELLYRETEAQASFVAVTGTNGKSTTTALIGHVLEAIGRKAHVGGNIGRSALDLPPPAGEQPIYVLELSSYQLDLIDRFRPRVSVWLNLTPDHLDRHGGFAGYRAAKERIFRNQTAADTAVLGVDEPVMREVTAALSTRGGSAVRTVTVTGTEGAAISVDSEGILFDGGVQVGDLSTLPTLRGSHNWQNAACAYACVAALGGEAGAIVAAMATFPGLDHRMQVLGRRGRVLFVNDSKATNAEAAARSLATFAPIYWIAGGRAKEGGIRSLAPYFDRVAKAYLIGEAADGFSATLAGRVPHTIAGDLATAVAVAAADAALDPEPEPAVLLAPAAASFDQFRDFEARGAAFAALVAALDQPSKQEAMA